MDFKFKFLTSKHFNLTFFDKKFLITGIGINIIKNPNITNYPATNLQEVSKKSISKLDVENKLKQLFEKNLSKLYKIK